MSEQMNAWDHDRSYIPLRLGSNFEVPKIWPNAIPGQFSLAVGNSKKLYLRALSRALVNASFSHPITQDYASRMCRSDEDVADRAFYRLQRLEDRASA